MKSKQPTIELRRFGCTDNSGCQKILAHEVIFVLQGTICLSLDSKQVAKQFYEGELIFVPLGVTLFYEVGRESAFLVVRFSKTIPIHHSHECSSITHALKRNDHIKHYIDGVLMIIERQLLDAELVQAKTTELIHLIRLCYSHDEYRRFFSVPQAADAHFHEFVHSHYLEYRSVSDMATALNMSERCFARKFKKIFGVIPSQWIHDKIMQQMHEEILYSHKSLKEIAIDYHFSAYSNFSRHCKKTYGLSPKRMRQEQSEE